MSYGIIQKSGGNILFTSYPAGEYPEKHGTTFTVYLQVISGQEALDAPPAPELKRGAAL